GSRSPFPKEFEKIAFVASGTTFADALSGGAAAAAWGGPLLLTRPGALPTATRLSLAGLRPDAIVVLGGASAVSDTVVQELQAYVPAPDNVTRISSADRYGVSALTARLIGRAPVAFVANGTTFADGLAGGAAAGSAVSPLLLTRRDSVPGGVMSVLTTTTRPQRIYVLGGAGAVSDAVVRQLEAVAPVTRVDGSDRYVVAARVAAIHPTNYGATVASGETWPDALAATAFAGLMGDKLLLLRGANAPGAT